MTTITDLASSLGVRAKDLLALIDSDPTGPDYIAGPNPDVPLDEQRF